MKFTDNKILFLRQLNGKLAEMEVDIKKEMLGLQNNLKSRVADKDDFLEDYRMLCHLTFLMREDAPKYAELDDKIITELQFEEIEDKSSPMTIGSGANVNSFKESNGHPLQKEHHCWSFRCLYEEAGLSWEKILKIGTIWVDIDVSHKKNYVL